MVLKSYIQINADGEEEIIYYEEPDAVVQNVVHEEVNVDDGKVKIDGDHDNNAPIVIKRTLGDGHPYIKFENEEGVQTFAVDGDGDVEVEANLLMQQRADGTTGAIATQGLISLQGNSALLYSPYDAQGVPMGNAFEMRFGRAEEIGDSSHDQDGIKMKWGTNRGSDRELLINPLGQTPALRVNSARSGETNYIELNDNLKDVFKINYEGKIRSDQIHDLEADDDLLEILVEALDRRVTSLELPGVLAEEEEQQVEGHRAQKKRASAPDVDSLHATQQRLNNYISISEEDIHTLQGDHEDVVDDIRDMSIQLSAVKGDVTSNTSNITSNASSISTQALSIATNTTNITTNANAITALQGSSGGSSNPIWWYKSDVLELVYNADLTASSPYEILLSSDMSTNTGKPIHFAYNNNPSGSHSSQSYFLLPETQSDLESLTPGESYFRIINTNMSPSTRSRIRVIPMTGSTGMGNTVQYKKPGESSATAHVRRILLTSSSPSLGTYRDVNIGRVSDFVFYGSVDIGSNNTRYILWKQYQHFAF